MPCGTCPGSQYASQIAFPDPSGLYQGNPPHGRTGSIGPSIKADFLSRPGPMYVHNGASPSYRANTEGDSNMTWWVVGGAVGLGALYMLSRKKRR